MAVAVKEPVHLEIVEKYRPVFVDSDWSYCVLVGGRNSCKSWTSALYAVLQAVQKKTKVLCCREIQKSIQDSTYSLLVNTIERLGYQHFFKITNTSIEGINGSSFHFAGLRTNIDNIKSFEDVDLCIVEEAATVSEMSWQKLIPTIRKDGSKIIVVFNPASEIDPTYKIWVVNPLPNTLVIHSSYQDNPFLADKTKLEIEHLKNTDYDMYSHVYLGTPNKTDSSSLFKPEWIRAAVDAHKVLGFQALGVKCLSFDPADEGNDAKAICIAHGSVINTLGLLKQGGIEQATDWAFNEAFDNRCSHLVYDGTGVGTAVKMGLEKRISGKNLDVRAFIGASSPDHSARKYLQNRTNKETFRNLRAQYFWLLRDRFLATYNAVVNGDYIDPINLISLPKELPYLDELIRELGQVRRNFGNNSFIEIESKIDLKSRGGKSYNLADALAMVFANNPPRESQAARERKKEKLRKPKFSIA